MIPFFNFSIDLTSFIKGITVGIPFGVILQVLMQHYLARRRDKEHRLAKAKNRFREAILAELSIFLLNWVYWPKGIDGFLLQAVPKLQAAVQVYRHCVKSKDLDAFDKAWKGFVSFCNQRTTDHNYTAAKMYPSMSGQDPAELIREHINRLLSFAKN